MMAREAWHSQIERRLAALEERVSPAQTKTEPGLTEVLRTTIRPPLGQTETTAAAMTPTERTTIMASVADQSPRPGQAESLVLGRVLNRQQHRLLPITQRLAQALDLANECPEALWLRRPLAQMLSDLTEGLDFPVKRGVGTCPQQEEPPSPTSQLDYSLLP